MRGPFYSNVFVVSTYGTTFSNLTPSSIMSSPVVPVEVSTMCRVVDVDVAINSTDFWLSHPKDGGVRTNDSIVEPPEVTVAVRDKFNAVPPVLPAFIDSL